MIDDRKPVHYANIEAIRTPTELPDCYEYRPERGWCWLQRAALGVLSWLGAHRVETVTTFVRTPQENDDLLKSLLGSEGQWIEFVHNHRDGARILMGPDDHPKLMALCHHMGMHPFDLDCRIETRDGRSRYGKWHDIPITVVPWMVGAVVVPD